MISLPFPWAKLEAFSFQLKVVFLQIVEKLDSRTEAEEELEHPLASLAESIEDVARKEASVFAPILSKWHPHAIAIAASLLHGLYQKELVSCFVSM